MDKPSVESDEPQSSEAETRDCDFVWESPSKNLQVFVVHMDMNWETHKRGYLKLPERQLDRAATASPTKQCDERSHASDQDLADSVVDAICRMPSEAGSGVQESFKVGCELEIDLCMRSLSTFSGITKGTTG